MTAGVGRYVATRDIRAAVDGHETDLLDALKIDWRRAKPHIPCPYQDHDDANPSWRWDERKCTAFCTCGARDVLGVLMGLEGIDFAAAKIRAAELLRRPDVIKERRARKRKGGGGDIPRKQWRNGATPCGCRLTEYAEVKRLPLEFLLANGLREISYERAPAISIPYFSHDGSDPAVRFRIAVDGPDHFRWRKGSRPRLYGLHRLPAVYKAGYVVLVEGESDCHTLWLHGFPALGLPGAGNWNEGRDASLLAELAVIYIVIEPDKGGEAVMKWLRGSSIARRVKLVRLRGAKDPSALYLVDPEAFAAAFQRALDEAEPFCAIRDREAKAEAAHAAEAAGDLVRAPDILARFVTDVRRAGLVGEDRNAKILYLAMSTRLFDRPVSIAVKGPSGGGKSYTVEIVLRFFPATAYWERTAMSDRALAYSDEDFRHRHLVIYEAAGMTSDITSYLIRSLLSEGRIRYELVEKTKDRLRARLIEKEGPTGLIVTTTEAKLHPENETRLLSLTVKDTAEQTKAILHALARGNETKAAVQFGCWQAFQKWLEAGERRVVVPFADRLAELVPPIAVRLRRDFKLLLALIQAHALLHRERRGRDDQGRIVATLCDYAAVRELISDLFSEGIEATIAKPLRETVEVVLRFNTQEEVSVAEIAKTLDLDKSSVSRRVKVAISKGYLVNRETGKGKRARIALGDPMPDDAEILPHLDRLADRCTDAALQAGKETPSSPADCDAELAEIEI
jgi:MarR family